VERNTVDTLTNLAGGALAYAVVGLAVLIVAVVSDVLDPAKRRQRRQRRDAYAIARRAAVQRILDEERRA
jgi:hypothetical protein